MTEYYIGQKEIECDENTAIINIDKCRLGQQGEFEMFFNGVCSRFEDLEQQVKTNYNSNIIINRNEEFIPF